jgi:hypothetical protein
VSQYHSINAGETERFFTVVARASGAPITAGTVNYYLKAKSGDNAGKWWKNADETWDAAETANAMTHEADGHWEIDLASTPFADGTRYLEYVKESGDLHVPQARHLIGNVVKEAVTLDWFADVSSKPTIGTSTLTQEQAAVAAAAAIDAKGYLLQSPDEDETAVSRLTQAQSQSAATAAIEAAGLVALLTAQREIDQTTTPWQLVLKDRTTGAELYRFDLTDENGDAVAAIDTFVAAMTTPPG